MKLRLNICIDNSSSKGSSNSSTSSLLSSRTVLIWLAIVTSEAFLFNSLHDLISSLFILNYSWGYEVQKPRWTRKVLLKFQLVLSHEKNVLFQRSLYHFPASKLSLHFLYLSSSLFCPLRKIANKNLPLGSCFGEIKFCWESAEIWLPYHLGSIYAKWLALRANFNLKKFENLSIQFEKQGKSGKKKRVSKWLATYPVNFISSNKYTW